MEMFPKRQILILCLLSLPIISIFSQKLDFGITGIYNSSAQTNYDPTRSQDGTFQWNSLGTWGIGIYVIRELSPKFAPSLTINYQTKGYKELAQIGYIPGGPIYNTRLENTFNYISADVALRYMIFKPSYIRAFLKIGIEYSYLINYQVESDRIPINEFYPVNEYQDRWEKNTLNVVPSILFDLDKSTSIEFGFNGSITPVLKTENLVVRDWIWTIRVSQSIPSIFKKTAKK